MLNDANEAEQVEQPTFFTTYRFATAFLGILMLCGILIAFIGPLAIG